MSSFVLQLSRNKLHNTEQKRKSKKFVIVSSDNLKMFYDVSIPFSQSCTHMEQENLKLEFASHKGR